MPTETEDRAWILSQMGHLRFIAGRIDDAENILRQALNLFPGYHYALGNLAKVRITQKRYAEAVTLLQERYEAAPHAENLYDLAEALELAGRKDEAKNAFKEFETKSLAESTRKDNSSRELTFYYADHAHEPAKALEIAEQELRGATTFTRSMPMHGPCTSTDETLRPANRSRLPCPWASRTRESSPTREKSL